MTPTPVGFDMLRLLLLILLPVAALGVFSLGVLLLWRGLWGTPALDRPQCRACRYDLRAASPLPAHCPECGSDLSPTHAVVFTGHRRRPLLAATGVAMLLLPLIFGGLLMVFLLAYVNLGPSPASPAPTSSNPTP